MGTLCACGSGRGMLAGVAGRQVWRVDAMRQTSPPWQPCGCAASLPCPWLGVEATRRPDRAGSLPVLSAPEPAPQGFCGMGEAGRRK